MFSCGIILMPTCRCIHIISTMLTCHYFIFTVLTTAVHLLAYMTLDRIYMVVVHLILSGLVWRFSKQDMLSI